MKQIILSLCLVIFPLLGIIDAGYITYEKMSGVIPPCNPYFQCGQVLESSWSQIGPVPLSAMGMLFYTTFLVFGILHFFEVKELRILGVKIMTDWLLVILGFSGFGFSLYLVTIMGVILHSWCFYCLLSALNCLVLFLLTLVILADIRNRHKTP